MRDLDTAVSEAQGARGKTEKALSAARAATEMEQKNAERLLADVREAEQNLEQHRQLLAQAEKSLIGIERALAEKESRLDVLKQLNEEGEGLAEGSRAVLKGLEDPKRIQAGLAGALVAKLDVDPKFVGAIEAALGRNLRAIILQKAEIASEIIATLTTKKLGKTALFIPELSKGFEPHQGRVLPERALAWAIDAVNAPEPLRPLLQGLLHDVVIFGDLDEALRFKRTSPQFAVATLAGEFISVAGILFGGSGSAQRESILERKSRISILTAEHSVLSAQRDSLQKKRDDAKSALEKTTARLEESRAEHRAADLTQTTAGGKIVLLERELEEASRKIDNLLSEKTTLQQQIEVADDRVANWKANSRRFAKISPSRNIDKVSQKRRAKDATLEEEKAASN